METHILVCDDEPMVREVISVVLSMTDYNVETAAAGEEALQKILSHPGRYSLLLTDHKMKALDGLGLVKELRAHEFQGKIIILSGRLDHADVVAYNNLNVDGILLKPFDFNELRKTVSHVLSPHSQQELVNCEPSWEHENR